MLRTLFFYLIFYPWTLIAVLLAVPLSLFGQNAVHNLGAVWGRSALLLAGLKIRVRGTEHIPQNRSAVYIANHQSNFDIPILYGGLPLQFRWLAKQELFDIPLFGQAMRRCGYIPIDRSDSRKSIQSMNAAAKQINEGASVVVFPEGTRSADGRLQDFKKGGFLIAIKAQVPVVPVAIKGSFEVMSKGSLRIHRKAIEVEIFPPIETSGLKSAAADQLLQEVRKPIAGMLEGTVKNDQNAA